MQTAKRVVIITGAGYGIGRALALYFAGRGDAIIIADRDACRGQAVELEIRESGSTALFIPTDIRQEKSIGSMIEQSVGEWGGIDILCNNAGIECYKRADEFTSEEFNGIVETNLRGMFLASKHAFPHLAKRRGCIVNISSVQAIANESNSAIYAASKAGVLGLTRGMAVDFAPAGVRVNAVCPGAIDRTGMMENALKTAGEPAAVKASASKAIPLGRMGTPEEIAAPVYFLASGDAGYISGASLVVDGALLARLAL